MDLSFALGGRGPRNAKSRFTLPPAHTRGGSELNTYPQGCEENVSRRSYFAHDFVSTVANWCRSEGRTVEAEPCEERSERRAQCALGAVLDLECEREAVRRGRTEKRFGSAFGDPARKRLHQVGVRGSGASDQFRVRTHRVGDPAVDAAEGDRDLRQRQREGDDAAAVDGGGDLVRVRQAPHLLQCCLLARMLGQAVALGRPALRTAQCEHPRVLPGAVVLELRPFEGAALEVVLGGGRLREECSDRLELTVVGEM